MRRARGAEFVTGKSEGVEERVNAEEDEGGVCWTRQVEMLFTVDVSRVADSECESLLRTTL